MERMCDGCHSLESITRTKRTKKAWTRVVGDMVERGAKGSPQEIETVIDYLAEHFGREPATPNQQ
jgi:competence protein ComEA